MTNDFLPPEYEMPEGESRYMKFEEGVNTIRILSLAIVGWKWWIEDEDGNKTSKRVPSAKELPEKLPVKVHHFWAFVVYNHNLGQIQILEITQKTIMRQIKGLIEDKDWGDPKTYDLSITRTKTGSRDLDVEYSVMPKPKTVLAKEIQEEFLAMEIDLNELYRGGDPFNPVDRQEETKSSLERKKRRIFALGKDLNLDSETTKKMVKAKLKLGSFADITEKQADKVIKDMQRRVEEIESEKAFKKNSGSLNEDVSPDDIPF